MDANGTRYQLLLGFDDWGECTDADGTTLRDRWRAAPPSENETKLAPESAPVAWNAENYELTLQPRLFKFEAAPHDKPPKFENRRGAGRDRYGNWYWIDETEGRILVNSSGTNRTNVFWPTEGSTTCAAEEKSPDEFKPVADVSCPPLKFRALAVTEDHYLVVGVLDPAGLLIFDLHAGGAPQQVWWPKGVKFEPHDMAARAGGGVLVLDSTNKRYWELDRLFNVLPPAAFMPSVTQPDDFQPRGSDGKKTELHLCELPQRLTLQMSTRLFIPKPISIECLPDNSVLVLDYRAGQKFSRVHRYREGKRVGQSRSTKSMLKLIEEDRRADFSLVGYDFAFVPRRAQGEPDRLYIVAADGNQSYAFNLVWRKRKQITLDPVAAYMPMRLFAGRALVRAGTEAYYDFDSRWIPLVEQRRPRYAEAGTFLTRAFDGAEPDCVWHRLMLDACIPPGTRVSVRSRAANNPDDLELTEWSPEPRPYLRGDGTELPYGSGSRLVRDEEEAANRRAEGKGTWELLFQRARGRYLQLEITLAGNERATPRLRALRAYYPRFSYLVRYLPSVYREDDQSASFLERFLANLEGMYTSLEDKIAAVQVLFDVRSAPADALEWLSGWYGVALDPAWDEAKRRVFIKHAMFFFRYRGTMHGLELALRLVTDECIPDEAFTDAAAATAAASGAYSIRVVERYRTRRVPGVVFGDPTEAFAPRLVEQQTRWQPSQGSEALHATYRASLELEAGELYPIKRPAGATGKDWEAFSRAVLGFVPGATATDRTTGWENFLARRYPHLDALGAAYNTEPDSFADVKFPQSLPQGGEPLNDWYQFESVVVAMRQTAHRFTVLLPMRQTDTFDTAAHRDLTELARRIVELEKPAHTTFDIKFYWAMFRLGEVRLGDDTLLDLGSRAPGLMRPMLLGEEHLAESYLVAAHPQNVGGRNILGRQYEPPLN
ncbi:MAG TPA: phage tail protein [Pyrinomonadaceae bacterium]|nr:phage tail protein [Pyrinomonadaceae bacterium]